MEELGNAIEGVIKEGKAKALALYLREKEMIETIVQKGIENKSD